MLDTTGPLIDPADLARVSPARALQPIHMPRRARARLVAFPCAGASASFYGMWRHALWDDIAVEAVQPAGREERRAEGNAPLNDLVLESAAAILEGDWDVPLVLFGHSYGALAAYETAQKCRAAGRSVDALIVSGRPAPHMAAHRGLTSDLSDEAIMETLTALGFGGESLLAHPQIRSMMMPGLRADLAENDGYVWPGHDPLDCPIIAFAGVEDPIASPLDMASWAVHGTGAFTQYRMPGKHFFLREQAARITPLIRRTVRQAAQPAALRDRARLPAYV